MIEQFEPRLLLSGVTAEVVQLPGEWGAERSLEPVIATTLLAGSPADSRAGEEVLLPPSGDANVVNGIVYSNLDPGGGYVAFSPASGVLGIDDYNSINNANIDLGELTFIGGVTAPGSLTFEFQNSVGGVVGSFAVNFPQAGNFIYPITPPTGFTIPDAGRVRVIAPTGTAGQWFMSDALPTVGTEDISFGGLPPSYSHNFELFNGSATSPDLQPAALSGRADPITISTTTGTTTDAAQIPAGSPVFVDFGWGNFGDAAAGSFTTTLKLDGVVAATSNTASLGAGFGSLVSDFSLGAVSAGLHTLLIEVDTGNTVTEFLEGNNSYSRQFFVGTPATGGVSGFKWNDTDSDGAKDAGEPALSGWTIFADLNGNGSPDGGEPSDVTDGAGAYDLIGLPTGVYTIREVLQPGFTQTFPGAAGQSNHDFEIEVIYPDDTLTPGQKAAFVTAANRWEQIIKGDVPDLFIAGLLVDDVRIEASGPFIDGPSNILGSAGPRLLRGGSLLPATGVMRFDSADLADLEAEGALVDVILHEMGHVLGIGSIWQAKGLLSGAGTSNPRFLGPQATAEFNAIFNPDQASVPVANVGGPGSADSHWRESVLVNELMTPGYNGGVPNPISRITIGSLADIGYTVDLNAADPYTAPGPSADTYAGEPLDGYFVGLDEEPVIIQSGAITGSGSAVAFAHQVHVDPAEVVNNINFGNVSALPAWLGAGSAATWNAGTKALNVTGAASIVADPGADAPIITANGAAAVLTINPAAATQVNASSLTLTGGATATLTDAAAERVLVLHAGGVNVSGAGSALNLTDNAMVVKGGTLAGVKSLITSGFAGGAWNGNGIRSSNAAADATTALGYASMAQLGANSFLGVGGLVAADVVVRYTWYGDTNLDRLVNTDDIINILAAGKLDAGLASDWFEGDMTYDALANTDDIIQILAAGKLDQP